MWSLVKTIVQEARPGEPWIETLRRLLRPSINQSSLLSPVIKQKLMEMEGLRYRWEVPRSENIAVADYEIGGQQGSLQAVGGKKRYSDTIDISSQDLKRFKTMKIKGTDRSHDSEIKILAHLAAAFSEEDSGIIHLYSERPPCPSCEQAFEQFRIQYPHVELHVYSGIL